MSPHELFNLFPRWPLVFRSFLHPPLVARDVVTPTDEKYIQRWAPNEVFFVSDRKNFFWDHFLKELRNQAQLGNQAFWWREQFFTHRPRLVEVYLEGDREGNIFVTCAGSRNFFWDHFLKELRNQAQLSSQAYWICAQAFSCLRDLFCHTREYKELRRVVNTSSNF